MTTMKDLYGTLNCKKHSTLNMFSRTASSLLTEFEVESLLSERVLTQRSLLSAKYCCLTMPNVALIIHGLNYEVDV